MQHRTILHLDLDAFFCAVEEKYQPHLRGKPFAVGAKPDQRGVVASCSYPAREFGIHSAMPMATALRHCPHLIVVPHRRGAYTDYSRKVMTRLRKLTPLVEQLSIDEAFLEVKGGDGEATARRLQASIAEELGLPCSLGVATNKLVAKIANNMGKSRAAGSDYPRAITVVPPGAEVAFLAPLPTRELWGVGPKTAAKLEALGMHTIGDIAAADPLALAQRFGKHGADLARRAKGIDTRPIVTERTPKSLSRETTFASDVRDSATLEKTLHRLSQSVGKRLRRHRLRARTVTIKLRWSDFTTLTRQLTLNPPTDSDKEIVAAALRLLNENRAPHRPVRLIGVGVSNFTDEPQQLSLWGSGVVEENKMADVLKALREKFGEDVLRPAADLDDEH
jgi:DNA polymerase-4